MKKILLILFAILNGFVLNELSAQSFQTGQIGVEVNVYGRVRIHAPAIGATRQIDRSSILVGVGPNEVYDYRKDADQEIAPYSITSPTKSDFEIYGAFNNAYSNLPPNFLIRLNVYGWNNKPYIIAKFTVVNREASAKTSIIGIEVIPQPEGTYGLEEIKFSPSNMIAQFFRGSSLRVGYKILSASTKSFRAIDWYATYHDPDTLLWGYLTYGRYDTSFVAGGDGSVAFLAQNPVMIQPNDSAHFYVGIAVGANETELIANMNQAQAAYSTLVGVDDELIPAQFELKQNYPNPFNPKTTIEFSLPRKEKVQLIVYNLIGQPVKKLVDGEFEAGRHFVEFNADELSSGIYLYTIKAGDFTSTKKMILMK